VVTSRMLVMFCCLQVMLCCLLRHVTFLLVGALLKNE
jgi:hypothetical protein